MRPKCLKLAGIFQKMYILYTFRSLVCSLLPRDINFKNISVGKLWRKEILVLSVTMAHSWQQVILINYPIFQQDTIWANELCPYFDS